MGKLKETFCKESNDFILSDKLANPFSVTRLFLLKLGKLKMFLFYFQNPSSIFSNEFRPIKFLPRVIIPLSPTLPQLESIKNFDLCYNVLIKKKGNIFQ